MKQTEFLSNEAKIKISELQSDVKKAKDIIKRFINDDLGVNYIVWNDGEIYERLDFTSSIGAIYPYLELIKNCYACMDEIVKKSIETERHNEEKREYTEVNWAKALSDAVKCMNNYNTQSEIPQGEYKFCMNIDWGNRPDNEIKIGDRVKLKNDSNSPEMTVTRDLRAEAQVQRGTIGKGVQEETKYSGMNNNDPYAIFECSYFINKDEDVDFINRNCRQFQFHKDALQKLIPVQPSNKQKPTIESDIKAGDVVEMDDTKERFYVEELQTHGVKLVKVACYKLAAGNIYLTNYENMPFKKVERLNKQ